jgi:hypothetical protein
VEHPPKMSHLKVHTPHKKYEKDISLDVKKGDWYYAQKCKHAYITMLNLLIVVITLLLCNSQMG